MFLGLRRIAFSTKQAARMFSSVCYGREQAILYRRPIFGVTGRIMTGLNQKTSNITSGINIGITQVRWATRGGHRGNNLGNTYQPNTLKRKRRLGFLARMKSISGRKIIKNRKQKGRWFLTY